MVVLDAVVVVEIVDHDAEGFLDRTELSVAEPVDPLEPRAVAEVKAGYRVDAISGRWPSREPAPEARYRRQGGEALQLRKLRLELLDNLLDQEIAERNAAQPVLAIRDRIEDRRVDARGLCPRRFRVRVL